MARSFTLRVFNFILMKRYKVIALSVGGRGNKIFKSGDEVNEDCFLPGHVEELVSGMFLQPIAEKVDEPIQVCKKRSEEEIKNEERQRFDLEKNALEEKQKSEAISQKEKEKTEFNEALNKEVQEKADQEDKKKLSEEKAQFLSGSKKGKTIGKKK